MPIYEFQCDSCGHCFEKLQKINDALPGCPDCKQSQVRKLVSAPSFQLKGSGWYKSDYKNTGKKAEENKSDHKTESQDNKKDDNGSADKGSKNNTASKAETTNNLKNKDAA